MRLWICRVLALHMLREALQAHQEPLRGGGRQELSAVHRHLLRHPQLLMSAVPGGVKSTRLVRSLSRRSRSADAASSLSSGSDWVNFSPDRRGDGQAPPPAASRSDPSSSCTLQLPAAQRVNFLCLFSSPLSVETGVPSCFLLSLPSVSSASARNGGCSPAATRCPCKNAAALWLFIDFLGQTDNSGGFFRGGGASVILMGSGAASGDETSARAPSRLCLSRPSLDGWQRPTAAANGGGVGSICSKLCTRL